MPKYTVKLFGFIPLNLTWVITILIDALKAIVDGFVKGTELGRDQKKIVRTLYYLCEEWARDVVEDTETPYDDEALNKAVELCIDTAAEGVFQLPIVPDDVQ